MRKLRLRGDRAPGPLPSRPLLVPFQQATPVQPVIHSLNISSCFLGVRHCDTTEASLLPVWEPQRPQGSLRTRCGWGTLRLTAELLPQDPYNLALRQGQERLPPWALHFKSPWSGPPLGVKISRGLWEGAHLEPTTYPPICLLNQALGTHNPESLPG